jgi:hypothetical protein
MTPRQGQCRCRCFRRSALHDLNVLSGLSSCSSSMNRATRPYCCIRVVVFRLGEEVASSTPFQTYDGVLRSDPGILKHDVHSALIPVVNSWARDLCLGITICCNSMVDKTGCSVKDKIEPQRSSDHTAILHPSHREVFAEMLEQVVVVPKSRENCHPFRDHDSRLPPVITRSVHEPVL